MLSFKLSASSRQTPSPSQLYFAWLFMFFETRRLINVGQAVKNINKDGERNDIFSNFNSALSDSFIPITCTAAAINNSHIPA
jgi:hypothetical protein